MKRELSPAVLIGAIVGLVAVIGVVCFLMIKSDPASQAPHAPPRYDPGAKAAESHSAPPGRGPQATH